MATWTAEEIQQVVQKVGKKSTTDQSFRKLLLENPKAAIKEVAGKEIPDEFTLKMVEADPVADMTFVLPPLQTDELSDRELDQVAGGRSDCPDLNVRECPNLGRCDFGVPTTTTTYNPSISSTGGS